MRHLFWTARSITLEEMQILLENKGDFVSILRKSLDHIIKEGTLHKEEKQIIPNRICNQK